MAFEVTVRTLSATEVTLSIKESDTILDVKNQLGWQCYLRSQGKELRNRRTVAECGIKPGDLLNMVMICSSKGWWAVLPTEEFSTGVNRRQHTDLVMLEEWFASTSKFRWKQPVLPPQHHQRSELPRDVFIIFQGPKGSPYEGLEYELHIQYPKSYPWDPFRIKVCTPLYHVAIDKEGRWCSYLLTAGWVPRNITKEVLEEFQQHISQPDLPREDVYGGRVEEYEENIEAFKKKVEHHTTFYGRRKWLPELHYITPPSFQRDVKHLLLVLNRKKQDRSSQEPILPFELVSLIISCLYQ